MHLKLRVRQGYKFQEPISRDTGYCRSEAGADRTVFFPWAFRTNSTGCSLADMSALRWSRVSIEILEISVLTPSHSNVIHSLGCFASKTGRINLQHSRIICPWLTLCFTLIYLDRGHICQQWWQKQNLFCYQTERSEFASLPPFARKHFTYFNENSGSLVESQAKPRASKSSRLPPDVESPPAPF